jgi:hypothetical protein
MEMIDDELVFEGIEGVNWERLSISALDDGICYLIHQNGIIGTID